MKGLWVASTYGEGVDEGADEQVWLDGIEGEDLPRLIESNSALIRVVAGPGSGKSTGLKRRVQRLIYGDGVDAERIFIGTFTRAIAKDLRETLDSHVQFREMEASSEGVVVSTLHSLAYRLLRENPMAHAGRSLRFLMDFEARNMLYDIGERLPELGDDHMRRDRLNKLLASWDQKAALTDEQLQGEMDRWLREHQGMLVNEVVRLATLALEEGTIDSDLFDHVIIDEYQDLTKAEQELVEPIWTRSGSLVVLGDNDQSIYSFRHNHPNGIDEFEARWADSDYAVEDVELPENRRSQESIVDLANRMMAQANGGRSRSPMQAIREGEINPGLVVWPDVSSEIKGLAKFMREQVNRSFLVLVPRRFIGYRLQDAIGPDAITSFHEEILESSLARERMTLLSLMANPDDRVALRAWFGMKGSVPEDAQKRNARAYESVRTSGLAGRALVEAVVDRRVNPIGTGRTHIVKRAEALLAVWDQEFPNPSAAIEYAFDPELSAGIEDGEKRIRCFRALESLCIAACDLIGEVQGGNLLDVVQSLRYRIATRLPLIAEPDARIRIMTLHGAKGLQADTVILAGMAEQIIPGREIGDSLESQREREEQRRLLYVAVTRARDDLVLSWARAVDYKDARYNQIRVDPGAVTTNQDGSRIVAMSRSTLLPQVGSPITGAGWLLRANLDSTG